jgi:Cys-tRNA(Pro)/Cys-tRNA(Cys) deacylase
MGQTRGITELRRAAIEHRALHYGYTGAGPAASEAARELGVEPERMLKTLVAVAGGEEPVFALVPADAELSLKKLAAAARVKHAAMAPRDLAERRTGYQAGGISPLGSRQALRVFIDESALAHERVCLNAGGRGEIVEVATADLVPHVSATVADLRRDQS